MRVGGIDFGIKPERDGGEDKVAQRETVPGGGKAATESCGLDPIGPNRFEAAHSPQQGGNVVGLSLAPDALKNLGDYRADEDGAIIVEQSVHNFLVRRLRAVEE